jgi:hypothetical protein
MRTSAIPRHFPTFLAWSRGLLAWPRGLLTDARLALIMVVWLFLMADYSPPSARCLWYHEVVIDGRVYVGPCARAPAGRPGVAVLLMAPAPLAAAAALCRPRGSLKRALGLIALVALELALIADSFPGRVLRHPQLVIPDPSGGGYSVIVDPHPIEEGLFAPPRGVGRWPGW